MVLPHEFRRFETRKPRIFKKKYGNKERFMTKPTFSNFALVLGLFVLALMPSTSMAQVGLAPKLPGKSPATASVQAASRQAKTADAPSYAYTLLSFPGSLDTAAVGINLGATTSKMEIVGGTDQGGFLTRLSGKKTVSEAYQAVNYPHSSGPQDVNAVNDSGQIVGTYDGYDQGYERSGGRFSKIAVPFAGAQGTFPYGINNSGQVVGGWWDSNKIEHGFTLIAGTYTSFDYPGGSETAGFAINSAGDIVGPYGDANGVEHAFLLSGGTYTSFDFPGADYTVANGINDAGQIVGIYCTTAECISTSEGEQGFLLSTGVFTTIAIPGEISTAADGINNNGVVVGFYTDAGGLVVSFLATP
jgi:uncharacterized membrane protein